MTPSDAVSTSQAALRPQAPSGTLTFLFTDLESSTRLWERFPRAMRDCLERHDAILAAAVDAAGGHVVKGTGDGMMAVFPSADDAVAAALRAQRALAGERWGETGPLRVRMGLHAGVAETRGRDYYGPTVNRTARLMAVAHGGQVLLSASAAALAADDLPEGAGLRDLGEHRLKDLARPERVFELVHPDIVGRFPPLATRTGHRGALPRQASTFVGRKPELEQIHERLTDDRVRVLTLVGPGGTGKTRLALQAAGDQVDEFEDGAVFVDLSTTDDTESVLRAIAQAIGLAETGGQPLLIELTRQLHEQRTLLILDNFEQVTAAADAVAQLLQGCPGLQLLVTSREPLHLRDEHLISVPPLSLPPPRTARSAEALKRFEAVQLFVDRAQAVRRDFRLTDDNAPAVAEICLRCDGLPLAIELATARLNLFSPEALRERLASRLQLLRGGARDLPARQQTLRATIDWSYRLLEPSEQRLLELLAVFSGAGVEAVEAVAAELEELREGGLDPLDGLASLLDKSLVRLADSDGAEARLLMLETIREYASERLDDRPQLRAAARRAHAAYFADFAQRQWQDVTSERRERALTAIAAEAENLRAAWRHWVTERDLEQLDRLVDSLWLLYDARGWYQATIELTTDLLDVLSSTPATPERASREITLQISLARALLAVEGYTVEVEDAYRRALRLLEGNRDLPQMFPVLRGLAAFYNLRAEFGKGAQVGREILHLAEDQGDPSMPVEGHLVLGYNLVFLGDLRGGLEHLDQGLNCFDPRRQSSRRYRLGNHPGVACLTTSGFTLWMLGFPDRALERADAAVALASDLDHPFTTAYALFHSAFLHLWRREPELVRERAHGVLDVVEDHDFQIWRAVGNCVLGAATVALGRHDEGLATIRRGMALYQGLKTPPVFWPLLLYVQAGACARAGHAAEGLALIDEALEVAGGGSGATLLPEFELLKGDLLAGVDGELPGAERSFQRAFDVARDLDARMSQLRAATRLCRLAREPRAGDVAGGRLRAVYESFTEGFATRDLIEAGELLAPGPRPA